MQSRTVCQARCLLAALVSHLLIFALVDGPLIAMNIWGACLPDRESLAGQNERLSRHMKPPRSILLRHAEQLESRCLLAASWGVDAIDAPEVWAQGFSGQGVVVAVIDSGVDIHRDLVNSIWVNRNEPLNGRDDDNNGYIDDLNGWNFVDSNNSPISSNSNHGTHMAGTIAAARNEIGSTGVAYGARIMPLRVFNSSGIGTTSSIASAIRYAVDTGADIINLSVEGTSTRNVTAALQYAADNDVLVVASAGNKGGASPEFPASISATLPNVISVGAFTSAGKIWPSSNSVGASGAVQVDAPGESILSTISGNEYAKSSGTSVAAAHVAGIAALAISADPDITAAALRDAIVAGATTNIMNSDSRGGVNALETVRIVRGLAATSHAVEVNVDFDGDGSVGFGDFLVLSRHFGKIDGVTRPEGDADGDGKVLFSDFLKLSQWFGAESQQIGRRQRASTGGTTLDSPSPDGALGPKEAASARLASDAVDRAMADFAPESVEDFHFANDILISLFSSSH